MDPYIYIYTFILIEIYKIFIIFYNLLFFLILKYNEKILNKFIMFFIN